MLFLAAKALHVIGFVSWFAGLFYVVRLFIYHQEAATKPDAIRAEFFAQYALMERRLWYIITTPAMWLTIVGGLTMLAQYGDPPAWLRLKLALVFALVLYHGQCGRIRRQLAEGRCRWSSQALRFWNEVATMLLVAIVCLAVYRTALSALWGVLGLVSLGVTLMIATILYRRRRDRVPAAGGR